MTSTPGQRRRKAACHLAALALSGAALCPVAQARPAPLPAKPAPAAPAAAPDGQWRYFGGSHRFDRYSPLAQITPANVDRLAVAWIHPGAPDPLLYHFPDLTPSPNLRGTPAVIDGIAYAPDALGLAEAFDAATGISVWVQAPPGEAIEDAAKQSTRGLDFWSDGEERRVLLVRGEYLYALDAKTGAPIPGFGDKGRVLLRRDTPDHAPFFDFNGPIVVGDVVVVGGNGGGLAGGGFADGGATKEARPEDIRGYDARSGALVWTFHLMPDTDAAAHWGEAAAYAGSMAAWAPLSADDAAGIVYIPTSSPTNPAFGGHRPGDNLYANSLIALDAKTGREIWHYQMVHHDLWDYDNASPPVLADITVARRRVPAVIEANKTGLVFVFNRLTGKPVWPIVERPVPASALLEEHAAPTQPIPTRPPAMDRLSLADADLIAFTPELRTEAKALRDRYVTGPLFTPPALAEPGPGARLGLLALPGDWGAAGWNTGAFDPDTQTYYAASMTVPAAMNLQKSTRASDTIAYQDSDTGLDNPPRSQYGPGPRGLPITKPPYGRITAYDMRLGSIKWAAAVGDGPRTTPDLAALNLPPLGTPGRATTLITKTLLFVADSSDAVPGGFAPAGAPMLHVFNKLTGKLLRDIPLPAGSTGSPITYLARGQQYVLVPVGSKTVSSGWVALTLKEEL